MARVPVSRDRVHPREWGRRAALGVALLPIVTCLAFASNASPGTNLSERVPAATAYALPAVSSAQRHHLGLDGVWELSSAKEAMYAGARRSTDARMIPGAPALRSS